MNKLNLPTNFKLNGNPIQVEFDTKYCEENNLYGEARLTEGKIILSKKVNGKNVTRRELETTFYHELVHQILHHSREDVIKYNEDFVEKLAQLFYEFEKTRNAK